MYVGVARVVKSSRITVSRKCESCHPYKLSVLSIKRQIIDKELRSSGKAGEPSEGPTQHNESYKLIATAITQVSKLYQTP